MVFSCAAPGCHAHSAKSAKTYPFMQNITWVKFPKDNLGKCRWTRLLRRGGKDPKNDVVDDMIITKRTRLCSRHFDKEQLSPSGEASGDPKYFTWNNWGRPDKERPLSTYQQRKLEAKLQVGMQEVVDTVPDFSMEVTVEAPIASRRLVGKMTPLADVQQFADESPLPPPAGPGHDYIETYRTASRSMETQTSLTMKDIENLVKESSCVKLADPDPEQFVDNVIDTNERAAFYTGIDTVGLLKGVFSSIKDHADGMKYWKNSTSAEEKDWEGFKKPGRRRKLSLFTEFILTLMRLRLNLPILLLADLFLISATTVSEITITWISFLHQSITPALLIWPTRQQIRERMPYEFQKHFPSTRVVIDCSEFYIDRPSNKEEQYKTYSSYKSHNTLKCLIGVSPTGAFTYISELWSGNVSDKYITEHCGIIDLLDEGDEVMADRGFRIEDLLLVKKSKLVAPPFTRKTSNERGKGKRLNVNEIRQTRLIARLRIHVERAIQRLKVWRILQHQIPLSLQNVSSQVVKVVAALCNLKGPLFYSQDEQGLRKMKVVAKHRVKRLARK